MSSTSTGTCYINVTNYMTAYYEQYEHSMSSTGTGTFSGISQLLAEIHIVVTIFECFIIYIR